MKLSPEQQKKLLSRLTEIWKDKTCEICRTNEWQIDDTLFEIREYHGGATIIGSGAIKPLITIACSNCGNTKLMNAIKLGLIDTKTSKEGKGGSDE